MHVKMIEKPAIKESLQYGTILSWKFRDTITPVRGKFAYRFLLTFSSGMEYTLQKGGYLTEKEAMKAKEFTIAELHSKKFIPFEYTIKEFFDFWLYYHMIDVAKISYNTFFAYRNIIYNYLLKVWDPNKKITDIKRTDIIEALDYIDKESVLRLAYTLLRGSFSYAKAHQITRNNPALTAIRMKRKAELKKFHQSLRDGTQKNEIKEYQILSIPQISLLLLTCKNTEPEMYLPLLLSLTAGLRISEAIAIKFSDIDLWEGELHIRRQLGRTLSNDGADEERLCTQEIRTKSRSGNRDIPLGEFVIEELILARHKYESMQKSDPDFQNLDFVCFKEDGSPYHRSSFNKSFKKLLAECGLPDMRWHDLRHTYATVLKENEISLKAISACMGHHGTEITENVYINLPKAEVICECEKEMADFMRDILPQKENVLDIHISDSAMFSFL